MPLTVAIVGRPNVGKSTLFNRLAGRKLAIVHDTPGVTRDRQRGRGELGALLPLIDTAGFEAGRDGSLTQRMTAQTMAAIAEADVCLFVIDAREGVTAGDEIIADALRRAGKPVILAANKCESRASDAGYRRKPMRWASASRWRCRPNTASGWPTCCAALPPFAKEKKTPKTHRTPKTSKTRTGRLRLAIVGRPNVGKSSLFNRLLGSERALTGPEAGITRDAVAARWEIGRPRGAAARHRGHAQEGPRRRQDAGRDVRRLDARTPSASPNA